MKNLNLPLRRIGWLLAALFMTSAGVKICRADTSVRLDVFEFDDLSGGSTNVSYAIFSSLSSTVTPVTYDEVFSPLTNSYGGLGAGNSNGAVSLPDLAAVMNEITNANGWKIVLNVGDASQKVYTFHASLTNFSSNLFTPVTIVYPPADGVNITTNLILRFTGPATWSEVGVDIQGDQNYFDGTSLPADSTYWVPDQPLNSDTNFNATVHFLLDGDTNVVFSTPLDAGLHPLAGWSSDVSLDIQAFEQFSSGFQTYNSDPGHVLVAHYSFDDQNDLGHDNSGNGNDINTSAGFINAPPFYWTNNSIAGGGAVKFQNGSWLIPPGTLLSNLAGSYSVSLWLKTSQTFGSDDDQAFQGAGIIAADQGGVANDAIPMALTGSKLGFFTGNPDVTIHSQASINTGTWNHLVVTRDRASGQKLIYVNGVLDSDGMGSTNLLNDSPELQIGENPGSAGIVGIVDDVQFYAGVLDSNEVASLYASPGTPAVDVTFSNDVPLDVALNATNLTWMTSGSPGWIGQTGYTHDQVAAAESGSPPDSFSISTLQTTIQGEGILDFWWASQADPNGPFDMEFDFDGSYVSDISGVTGWNDSPYSFGPGAHTLTWFTGNFFSGSPNTNDGGFLDQFAYETVLDQPSNAVFYAGAAAALLATVNGNPPPLLQWQSNNAAIPGATNAQYIITNAQASGPRTNHLRLQNDAGTFFSQDVSITVTNDAALPAGYSVLQDVVPSTGGSSFGQQILVASNGDVYATGNFTGTNSFGATVLADTNGNLFIGRISPAGTWLWAKQGGSTNTFANAIAQDSSGQLLVAGSFQGTAKFGAFTLTNAGSYDAFLARFDTNGNCNLALRFGSAGNDFIEDITFDASSNIYVCGYATDSVQAFGGSASVAATNQPVIVSYTPAGALRWEVNGNGSDLAFGDGLRYLSGSLYLVGWRTGVIGFGSTNLSGADGRHSFLARFNTNGVCNLVTGMASSDNSPAMLNDFPNICYGPSNTLYIAGNFQGADGVFGGITLTNPSGNNSFVARFDTNCNFLMARLIGNSNTLAGALSADSAGNVYVGGTFSGVTDFGGRSLFNSRGPVFNPADRGNFVAKYATNGTLSWVRGTEAVTGSGTINFYGGVDVDSASGTVYQFAPAFGSVYYGTNLLADPATNAVLARIGTQIQNLAVTLVNPLVTGTNFSFSFISTSGHTNVVLATTNIAAPVWTNLSNIVGDGTLKTVVIPETNIPRRYFRVQTQ